MENRSHALAAGLFTILLGTALILIALWFNRDTMQRSSHVLHARGSVTGLNVQATVKYRGVEVGKVERIRFDPDDTRNILIEIAVNADTPINAATYGQLGAQGVTGLAFVQLDDDPRVDRSGPAPARIELRPSVIEQVSDVAGPLLSGAVTAAQRVNAWLSDENLAQARRLLGTLDGAAARAERLAEAAEPAVAKVPRLLDDGRMTLRRADALLLNIDRVVQDVGRRVEVIDRLAVTAERVAATGETLGGVGRDLGRTAQGLAGDVQGGTLPRLNTLIDEARRVARNADQAVSALAEEPHALVFGRDAATPGPGEPGFENRSR